MQWEHFSEKGVQKSLELSEQEALRVLVFMAGMEAGRELQFKEENAVGRQAKENVQQAI